jgi:hypothetical protein
MATVQFTYDPEEAAKAAAGGSLMPAGWYVLRVKTAEQKAGAPGKHPFYECKCEIIASFDSQNVSKTVTRRFSLNPKSAPYNLMRFLGAAGLPFAPLGQGSMSFDDAYFLGATTKVICKHTAGESRTFENWDNDEPYEQPGQQRPAAFTNGVQFPQAAQPAQYPQAAQPQQWQPPAQQFQPPMQQPMQYPQPQQGFPQQAYPPGPMQGQPQPMQYPQAPPQQPPPAQPMQGQPYPPQQFPQNPPMQNPPVQPNGNGQPQGWPPGAWPQQPPQQGR